MQADVWYELMLRELSAGPDTGEDLRREAETVLTEEPAAKPEEPEAG